MKLKPQTASAFSTQTNTNLQGDSGKQSFQNNQSACRTFLQKYHTMAAEDGICFFLPNGSDDSAWKLGGLTTSRVTFDQWGIGIGRELAGKFLFWSLL